MASNDTTLQIVVNAIDNASAALQSVGANVSAALGATGAQAESTGSSFAGLEEHILASMLAYRVLLESVEAVKGFFEGSVEGAIQASATMAQVKVDVDNAGLSYATMGPKIDEVAKSNEALGFTQEDTQLSMGKLLLATGDYSKALKLNQLAMDLSRAKGIDLNDATVLLQQVMAGNTRALKQYGISLDSATTSGEALDMLQQKLQGSAAAFANTSAGQMAVMQAQWEELQVQVGQAFMPVLEELFGSFEQNLPEITSFLTGMGDTLAQDFEDIVTIGQAVGIFQLIGVAVEAVIAYVKLLSDSLNAVADAIREVEGTTQSYANSQEQLGTRTQQIIEEYNQLHPKLKITADDFKQLDLTQEEAIVSSVTLAEKQGKIKDSSSGLSTTFDDIKNHIQAANNAAVKHADAVAKLSDEYDKMQQSGETDLSSLADAFTTKMASINKTIADTKQQITDLTDSYNQAQQDDTAKVAESIVASAQKIADIKTQLAQATSDTERARLQEELTAEQQNYASSEAWQNAHQAAMSAAVARGSETDLQRTIDDYNAKEAKATEQFNDQIDKLNKQLAASTAEAAAETKTYNDKVAAINKVLDQGQAYFNKLSAERVATTTKEVDAEVAQFQKLAAAISQIKSASASAVAGVNIPSLPVTSVHDAIITPSGIVQTDPADFLIATKTPGALGGSGGSIFNIYIQGGNYLDSTGATMIANAIGRQIVRQLRVSNFN